MFRSRWILRTGLLSKAYLWFAYPHRLLGIKDAMRRPGARLLDVGCGNGSPHITKTYFPDCEYYGLDKADWNPTASNDPAIDEFIDADLDNESSLHLLKDGTFDAVVCSHVLEHVRDPYSTALALSRKVAPGGILYIETPDKRTLLFPTAKDGWLGIKGCLNFWDDSTHVSVVDMDKLVEELSGAGFEIRKRGPRFLWRRVFGLPAYVAAGLASRRYVPATVVWDVTRFANVLIARKPV